MLVLKACPRCHGDLVLEYSPRANYYECLQCGHVLSAEQERLLGTALAHGHHDAHDAHDTHDTRQARPAACISRKRQRSSVNCRAAPPTPAALALRRAFRPAYLP